MKLELKIIKQFAIDENTIALQAVCQPRSQGPFSTSRSGERTLGTRLAVCGKNIQRKYHEMRLIFTPGISQPQGSFLAISSIDPLAFIGI